jgi:hypothetical protein
MDFEGFVLKNECQSGRKGTMLKTLDAMLIVLAGACGAKVD